MTKRSTIDVVCDTARLSYQELGRRLRYPPEALAELRDAPYHLRHRPLWQAIADLLRQRTAELLAAQSIVDGVLNGARARRAAAHAAARSNVRQLNDAGE